MSENQDDLPGLSRGTITPLSDTALLVSIFDSRPPNAGTVEIWRASFTTGSGRDSDGPLYTACSLTRFADNRFLVRVLRLGMDAQAVLATPTEVAAFTGMEDARQLWQRDRAAEGKWQEDFKAAQAQQQAQQIQTMRGIQLPKNGH